MEFKEFAHILKPIIGGGSSTHSFTRTLFETILIEDSNAEECIESISKSSFKSYYNGHSPITKTAKRILPYIEPENFILYLDSFPDAISEQLCDLFTEHIEDINSKNVLEKIAYHFKDILIDAASQKRKNTPKGVIGDNLISVIQEEPCDDYPYSSEDWNLLREFNSDFDEIVLTVVSEKFGSSLLDRKSINNFTNLYESKWKEKADSFSNPTLKSHVFGILGELHILSVELSNGSIATYQVKKLRLKLQKLYTKLHPDRFSVSYPYAAFIDDWDDIDY